MLCYLWLFHRTNDNNNFIDIHIYENIYYICVDSGPPGAMGESHSHLINKDIAMCSLFAARLYHAENQASCLSVRGKESSAGLFGSRGGCRDAGGAWVFSSLSV